MQDAQNNVDWDAVLFVNGSQLHGNLVQHAVLLLYANVSDIDAAAARAAANPSGKAEPLFTNTVSSWVEQSSIVNNLLLASNATKIIAAALAKGESSQAVTSAGGSAAVNVQQFFLSRGVPSSWVVNNTDTMGATNRITNPLVVALHQDGEDPPEKSKQLVPPKPKEGAPSVSGETCEDLELDTRAPSVYWGIKSSLVGKGVSFVGNKGFPYALVHESGWLVHLQDALFREHAVSRSLIEIGAIAVVKGLRVEKNTAGKQLFSAKYTRLALLEVSRSVLSLTNQILLICV